MREKKKWIMVCVVTLSLTLFTGCGDLDQSTKDSLAQLASSARQQGYNEMSIELRNLTKHDIPEDSYNKYLKAKKQYEENMSLDNFQILVDVTTQIIQDLPISE